MCAEHSIALNFKLQKVGGIYTARAIEQRLFALGFKAESMIGGTFPTAIGRVYDQDAACALKSTTLHSDGLLPSTDYFRAEKHLIKENFVRRGGMSIPISGEGSGVTVDIEKLSSFVVSDPVGEYSKIRDDKSGNKISIMLRSGQSYRNIYERKARRPARWNL
jgi:L-alanine-DL-glutamate epimerase-like enolase superfamily enzyme